ncbi:MAG: DUF3299 domain-containing protein [Planctomycetota bacterium]
MKHAISAAALLLSSLVAAQPRQVPATDLVEFRALASAKAHDLAAETERLKAWLGTAGERVKAEPTHLQAFNALTAAAGGRSSRGIVWLPHVIGADPVRPGRWSWALREERPGVVPLYSAEDYALAPKPGGHLVELLAVDAEGQRFSSSDLDVDSIRVEELDGQPALAYSVRDDRREAYRAWTEGLIGESFFLVAVRGEVRSVSKVMSPIHGVGLITGGWSRDELRALASELREAAEAGADAAAFAAAEPEAEPRDTVVAGADGDEEMPASADPADLRAIQGAQQMLEAERRLRNLLKDGKIEGVDRILTFEEISSWPYEDGLIGLPKSVEKLGDRNVLMTGFMLPIDEVENIKEFLLVESLWSCCYGQPPDINGIVRVIMRGDSRIDYQFDPIKVVGTFKVEAAFEDGYCVDIFQLVADEVAVIE